MRSMRFASVSARFARYRAHELASQAKVSLALARNRREGPSGSITDQELEKEKGGSGLRYSFDIKSGKGVYEVGVDA
jgi:uncharacterized membrane protein YkoI